MIANISFFKKHPNNPSNNSICISYLKNQQQLRDIQEVRCNQADSAQVISTQN